KAENKMEEDYDIIGQFGVGFYAAFMVADEVTVRTKALKNDVAYEWHSDGAEGYTIKEIDKETVGTEVILRSEEHTSELQSRFDLVCRLLLEKKKNKYETYRFLMMYRTH